MDIKELLNKEQVELEHLDCVVNSALEDEHMLTSKLHEVENDDDATFGEKISDRMAEIGGSWGFIIGFFTFIIFWIAFNVYWLGHNAVDPYPFILLNLMLSCLAAFQAPVIMMSQNRQEEKDRRRARSDYMINLKAEMEIRRLHDKLDIFQKSHDELMAKISKENP